MPEQGPTRRLKHPAIFICDIQEKFRKAVWQYEEVIKTTQKVLRAAKILNIPIFITTQNRARLGPTCAELTDLIPSSLLAVDCDKTAFSMWTPSIASHPHFTTSSSSEPAEIILVGIESHICVTQTTLDLLAAGHKVYILADGVSSCNSAEIPLALARLRAEGATVTTSESWLYECMGDASIPEFKQIAGLVKELSTTTKETMQVLFSSKI